MIGDAAKATHTVAIAGEAATQVLPAVTSAAWAVPVAGAAVAGVTLALSLIFGRKGPKQKQEASRIADEAEQQLRANVEAYFSGPRTPESRAAALANFDYAWSELVAMWEQLGEPGRRAIAERGSGGRPAWGLNWFELYRDPIALDTGPAQSAVLAMPAAQGNALHPALLLGGAALIGALVL